MSGPIARNMQMALAIELSWFLRLRWADRKRQLYVLNDTDVSVLKTQAKGDIAAFRQRHGIGELVLSEERVSWRGCGKNTAPCPFNFYVNRLGLNTAPCCREHMKQLSLHIAAGLDKLDAVYWLEGGSLLGAVRENGALLDWEDDVDISVLLDDRMTWDRLATGRPNMALGKVFMLMFSRKKASFQSPLICQNHGPFAGNVTVCAEKSAPT